MRRWRTPRLIAVATAGLLAFGGVDVAAAGAADEQAAATEDAALALARQSGAPVVIESMAGERQLFVANPDGTIRAELTTAPARALVAGTWQDIDLTLADVGAVVRPRVSAVDLAFSDGGDRDLARLVDGGKGVTFDWQGTLPTPVIDGTTVTYPDVMPNVDLVLEAQPEGFSERLVVKARPAGALSASFVVDTVGAGTDADLSQKDVLTVETAAGTPVVAADAPLMWDAETERTTGEPSEVAPVAATMTPAADGTETLTLTADAAFLRDPDTTYPVIIDPSPNLGFQGDTFVDSATPATSYWTSYDLKVGKLTSGDQRRTFIKYDTSAIPAGAKVVAAQLDLYETWAASCTPRTVFVKRISGNLPDQPATSWWTRSGSITWSNQPPLAAAVWARVDAAKGFSASCPDGWITMTAKGDTGYGNLSAGCPVTTELCMAALVQGWLDGSQANYGIAVTADLTTDLAGKRFASANSANGPPLSVTYTNPPPSVPTITSPSVDVVPSATPTFSAPFVDVAGDSGRVEFRLTAIDVAGYTLGALVRTMQGTTVAAGATSTVVAATLPVGGYSVSARAIDSAGSASAYGSAVEFAIDFNGDVDMTSTAGMGPADGADLGDDTVDGGELPAEPNDSTVRTPLAIAPAPLTESDLVRMAQLAPDNGSVSSPNGFCRGLEATRYINGTPWQHRTFGWFGAIVEPTLINVLWMEAIGAHTDPDGRIRGNRRWIRQLRVRQGFTIRSAVENWSFWGIIQVGNYPVPVLFPTPATTTTRGRRTGWTRVKRRLSVDQRALWTTDRYVDTQTSISHPLIGVTYAATSFLEKPRSGYGSPLTAQVPEILVNASPDCVNYVR